MHSQLVRLRMYAVRDAWPCRCTLRWGSMACWVWTGMRHSDMRNLVSSSLATDHCPDKTDPPAFPFPFLLPGLVERVSPRSHARMSSHEHFIHLPATWFDPTSFAASGCSLERGPESGTDGLTQDKLSQSRLYSRLTNRGLSLRGGVHVLGFCLVDPGEGRGYGGSSVPLAWSGLRGKIRARVGERLPIVGSGPSARFAGIEARLPAAAARRGGLGCGIPLPSKPARILRLSTTPLSSHPVPMRPNNSMLPPSCPPWIDGRTSGTLTIRQSRRHASLSALRAAVAG
jgi:hypothetical protein